MIASDFCKSLRFDFDDNSEGAFAADKKIEQVHSCFGKIAGRVLSRRGDPVAWQFSVNTISIS